MSKKFFLILCMVLSVAQAQAAHQQADQYVYLTEEFRRAVHELHQYAPDVKWSENFQKYSTAFEHNKFLAPFQPTADVVAECLAVDDGSCPDIKLKEILLAITQYRDELTSGEALVELQDDVDENQIRKGCKVVCKLIVSKCLVVNGVDILACCLNGVTDGMNLGATPNITLNRTPGQVAGIFAGKFGTILGFNTIAAGNNINLSQSNNTITISTDSSATNTATCSDAVARFPTAGSGSVNNAPLRALDLQGVQATSPLLADDCVTANIDLALVPKGTGALTAAVPDGTTAGGNARGNYAVDLQLFRNDATQVASGGYAVVSGGWENTASGGGSVVAGGGDHTASGAYTVIGGGIYNTASDGYATIGGGIQNIASGSKATVGGGNSNLSAGYCTTVGGGLTNSASGFSTTIAGGRSNTAIDGYSTVGGGRDNNVSAGGATIAGGYSNTASGGSSAVAGGTENQSTGGYSTIGGGSGNQSTANRTVVAGGYGNIAQGGVSTVAGGKGNNASGYYSTISGGLFNAASGRISIAGGGENNTAAGYCSTVGGGRFNQVSGQYATIGGGYQNTVYLQGATIAGGENNTASDLDSFVGGGKNNSALSQNSAVIGGGFNGAVGNAATVGGGYANSALDTYAAVGGGYQNIASGSYSTIGGGYQNIASNGSATIPGGWRNQATAGYSFAAGQQAQALHDGAFVWNDDSDGVFTSTAVNQFHVHASGGVQIFTDVAASLGVSVEPNGTSWGSMSDRNRKENFKDVDCKDILNKLMNVPITSWNYKGQNPEDRNIGPMAQDFNPAFGFTKSPLTISTQHFDGVALAAIQGLCTIVKENKKEDEQRSKLQETRIAQLEAQVHALKANTTGN